MVAWTYIIPRSHHCIILSSPRLVAEPALKRHLGRAHDALAVDMESAVFARICSQRGIPFGCLRAISDDVTTPLSEELVELLAGGRISAGRVVLAFMRRPFLLKEEPGSKEPPEGGTPNVLERAIALNKLIQRHEDIDHELVGWRGENVGHVFLDQEFLRGNLLLVHVMRDGVIGPRHPRGRSAIFC